MPAYTKDLAKPIRRLLRALDQDCTDEELQLMAKVRTKDIEYVERSMEEGADPTAVYMDLRHRLHKGRSTSSSSDMDGCGRLKAKRSSRSRSLSRSRSRSRSGRRKKKDKKR
uniref:Uncharacterized protein n=1 Tax=Eutreptiella gymnastica TaxID=73025 RepID=A0A7S1NB90_9EUGL|mmetsp:Transcript_148691/g.259821  ORF Transcript_148691/g.259821 Transcript_148691/m.259821 type:complete len:112 (+) Transcript_148691:86-421(+)